MMQERLLQNNDTKVQYNDCRSKHKPKIYYRATGAIANPNMELLFNAPGLRAFDFTFQCHQR